MRTPRLRNQRRKPPATTVRTTSLTVPPSACLIVLKSSRSFRTNDSRRCGPIGTFSGVDGAGFRPAQATSPTPSRPSFNRSSASAGWVAADSALPASSNGSRASPFTPRAASWSALGSGAGLHGSPSYGACCGTGVASNSTVMRSTPAIPSTSAWWTSRSARNARPRALDEPRLHSGSARSSRCDRPARRARAIARPSRAPAARCRGA